MWGEEVEDERLRRRWSGEVEGGEERWKVGEEW